MKVMVLVPVFSRSSPIVGAFLFAKYLSENGVPVVFASLDEGRNNTGSALLEEIRRSGMEHVCLGITGWLGVLKDRGRLENFCSSEGVDTVIAYLLRPTLLASTLSGVVRFASVRGMLNEDYAASYGRIASRAILSMEIKALKEMDHVFSMTRDMTKWLIKEGVSPDAIFTINNFVDVKAINMSVQKDKGTEASAKRKGNVDIGVFSSHIKRKRVDLALRAVARLADRYGHSDVKLHLAGRGPLTEELKKTAYRLGIAGRSMFHGHLDRPLELMKDMDIVLLTSDSEGLPRCLMEALSLGKTCVASDIPGIRELIHDRTTGYLFPKGDARALAAVMDDIIRNDRYIPGERLVDFMLENYDVQAVCGRMLARVSDVYDICSRKRLLGVKKGRAEDGDGEKISNI